MPEVKRFVKDKGQADGYLNVEIQYVGGHSPVFIELDQATNAELSRTDLSNMNLKDMHELLRSKGFTRRSEDKDEL